MLKYFDDSVEEGVSDNLLSDNLLVDNLLGDDSPAYINSNINIDIKAKLNPDEDITGNNFLEKNSGINIKDLFQ